MAIKVNGTTVIDDSRNLQNVQGIKTINNTSILGSGNISAGASTTYNAVGTYAMGYMYNTAITENSTYSGSSIRIAGLAISFGEMGTDGDPNAAGTAGSGTLSGTWRAMGRSNYGTGSNRGRQTIFVRIS